jgi:hypothetical protein
MRFSGHPFVAVSAVKVDCNQLQRMLGFQYSHEEAVVNLDLAGIGTDRQGRCGLGLNENDAERGSYMAVTDSATLQRLRREESSVEQQGRQALNISVILKDFPQYAAARQKADVLLAKASSLREQITKFETV